MSHTVLAKGRRRRRIMIALALIGAASMGLVGLAYRRYTDSSRIRALAERYLQNLLGSRVSVASASFSLLDGLHLRQVAVTDPMIRSDPVPAPPNSAGTIFYCEEIRIEHDPLAILRGEFAIRSLIALQPVCTIVHDAESHTTNLAALFSQRRQGSSPVVLPTVEMRDARVRVLSAKADAIRTVENLRLTVRARPVHPDGGFYDVAWQSGDASQHSGISRVDVTTGLIRNVRGGLPPMSVEAVALAVNAGYDGASALRDLLGLDGQVRARDYNLIDESGKGRWATIDLQNATVSIPSRQEETHLAPQERYLRFHDVNGTVRVTAEGVEARFTGIFHGAACTVAMTLRGGVEAWRSLDDVAFDAELSVDHLVLPAAGDDAPIAERTFIDAWPPLRWFYDRFDPAGPVDLFIAAQKSAGTGEPLRLKSAELVAQGGSASFHRYPYRGDNIFGRVQIALDGVWIRRLCSEQKGGRICVDGWFSQARAGAAGRITVRGEDVPLDDAFFTALGSRFRGVREDFSPSGRIDLLVASTRPEGSPQDRGRWQSQTVVTLRDVTATYRHFPYTLEGLGGELHIGPGKIELAGLAGQHGAGSVSIDGSVSLDSTDVDPLALQIVGHNVSIDEQLLAALPPDVRENLRALHVDGTIDVETTVSRAKAGPTAHRTKVMIRNATARPELCPVPLTDITGTVHLNGKSATSDRVSAAYGDGRVILSGSIGDAGAGGAMDVRVDVENLSIDEALRRASPPRLRNMLSTWRVAGPFDATVRIGSNELGGPVALDAVAHLNGVSIEHDMFPIPLTDVQGSVHFTNNETSSTSLRARYGGSQIEGAFESRGGQDGARGWIRLVAKGLPLDAGLRGVLSSRLEDSWDTLQPDGTVDLRLDTLSYRTDELGIRRWDVAGDVRLYDVALPGAASLMALSGRSGFSGAVIDEEDGTLLTGTLELSTGQILGKTFGEGRVEWQYACASDGFGRLAFAPVDAVIYDGRLSAKAAILFDKTQATYDVDTMVQSMRVAPFLSGTRSRAGSADPTTRPEDVDGLANFRLHLSGTVGKTESRRGGGSIEVAEGRIYRLPLILAILHALQLNPPDEGVFEEAQAQFFVAANTVSLEDIRLRGSVVALVGTGTMKLPGSTVDLDLVNITPDAWGRLPVLTDVFEGTTRELVSLRVSGPVSNPTVHVRPLPNISDEMKRLFQRRKPRRVAPPQR